MNYLYLCLHLARLPPEQQAATRAAYSPVAVLYHWHLNLHGEHDFSAQLLLAEASLNMGLIVAWQSP